MKKLFTSAMMAASVLFGSLANAQTWTNVTGMSASKISCGAASRVVAVSRETSLANNNTYRLSLDNGQWDALNNILSEVSIASNGGVRGVNAAGSAQYFAPGATNWTGSGMPNNPFRKITTNGGISISITTQTSNNVYRQNAGSGAWAILPGNGTAFEASIASDSTLVVVGAEFGSGTSAYNLYQYKYSNGSWSPITGVMDKIAVMESGKMLGIKNNELFVYRNAAWSPAPIRAGVIDVSVGVNGTVYIATTATSNNVYRTTWAEIETAITQTWTVVPANFVANKISCGSASKVVSANANGNVYTLDGSFASWSPMEGSLIEVSVNKNGKIWGVDANGIAYYKNPNGGSLTSTTSVILRKIVSSSSRIYAISSGATNNVYRYTGGPTWTVAPGSGIASELAVSDDDQFYAVGQTFGSGAGMYNLYRYNFNTSAWAASEGVMSKVAVGQAGRVLGIKNNGLYIQENGVWRTTPVRTDVRDVAMASDGTIYIATTATSNNIIRTTWNLIINATPVTSVKSFQKENTLVKIYPNPSKGAVNLELLTNESITYVVTNALGQEISSGVLTETKTSLNLSNGFYFVKIQSREGMSVQKVVVE